MGKMVIKTEYGIREKVWVMNPETVYETKVLKCKACSGKGRIKLDDGDDYQCPKCYGTGENRIQTYHHKPISGTVVSLVVREASKCSGDSGGPALEVCYAITNPKARGCHNRDGLYHEERVFKTKKACQEHIDNGVA